ncbi:xanthine dehydrogenase accessory protein XdhC [Sneathiella marina]|uniref:Xanthine dehydrogenase accessory protein XdhC n=1 Tax=Sneathiella marina TaxID=2950108 RepID=A0ABY4W5T1_9PROT|nr:xanthine dehydrogenase accessory protein XdhC [Sneathiella marina]USG62274.1 xanthine dehydrogenase accessory protein XdhC [Sneathiella marina]
MSNWPGILTALDGFAEAAVLITVGEVKGSTPRETGATMLVTATALIGTIGGGRLEYLAIEKARSLLHMSGEKTSLRLQVPLGPELAQCCGGHVDILISRLAENDYINFNRLNNNYSKSVLLSHWTGDECRRQLLSASDTTLYLDKPLQAAIHRKLTDPGAEIVPSSSATEASFSLVQSMSSSEFHVTLFGAGHVGKAVVAALAPLPCTITWVDERAHEFPAAIPDNVVKRVTSSATAEVLASPAGGYFLVMTHSHQLDLEICEAVLSEAGESYLGLIGSATKKRKFEKRLAVRGLSKDDIARITCPIGLNELGGKRPAEIALSVAVEILIEVQKQEREKAVPDTQGAQAQK